MIGRVEYRFIRREYRSIATELGDDQRLAMEMEIGDASGKLTLSEAAGVVRREGEQLWQLMCVRVRRDDVPCIPRDCTGRGEPAGREQTWLTWCVAWTETEWHCCGASSLDLGQPLPREDERLLKAAITIQRAVSPHYHQLRAS